MKKTKKKPAGDVKVQDTDSFFNIFQNPKPDNDYYLEDAKDEADFIREDLIPNSIEHYLDILDSQKFVSKIINN